ncbi:ankyrin, partial [Rickenella mellea]
MTSTSAQAPQPQPVTPELLDEVHYQLALDASLQANNQASMSADAMQRRMHTGSHSDYVPTYVESPPAPTNITYSREDVQAVTHFFDAIIAGQVEAVQLLLNSGMDVECQDRMRQDMTPLYAAVRAEQSRVMFLLVNSGADVNSFSGDPDLTVTQPKTTRTYNGDIALKRTPLMRAAQNGKLRMVKDLVEQCNADPMAIAPDGQSAQRLAAKAGHRDIVKYLPKNRGGIRKRMRYDYHTRFCRIRSLFKTIYPILRFFLWSVPKFFVWNVPKFFLWSIPKSIIEELYHMARRIYRALPPVRTWPSLIWTAIVDLSQAIGRGSKAVVRGTIRVAKSIGRGAVRLVKGIPKFFKTCYNATKRFVKAIPDMTVRAAKAVGRKIKEIGRWTWDLLETCYYATKRFVEAIPDMTVRAFRAIGRTIKESARWTWKFIRRIGDALVDFVKSITDVFVTFYFYVESLIRRLRNVRFKDIVRAVQRVLRALFVTFPKALWRGLKSTLKFVDRVLTALTLGLWRELSWLAELIVRNICFVPEQIIRILLIAVQGVGKVFTELWLLVHPRSM